MDKLQAYSKFWESFGIPAFDELTVPIASDRKKMFGSEFPYITYETVSDDFDNTVFLTASLWYRESTWAGVTAKEKQISQSIGRGGTVVSYDEGAFWIRKRNPWATRMLDPDDDTIRRIVLQYTLEFFD